MKSQQKALEISEKEKAVSITRADGKVVAVNEASAELHGCSRDDLLGENLEDHLFESSVEVGRKVERAFQGEPVQTYKIQCMDGNVIEVEIKHELLTVEGETYAKNTLVGSEVIVEAPDDPLEHEPTDESALDDLTQDQLAEVGQNIRVDAGEGMVPLSAVVLDLAEAHNHLEKYKQGALELYRTLDERLAEERAVNPDSIECDVLSKVREDAWGVYLRVHRGDEELHGDRGGEFSGYFNN